MIYGYLRVYTDKQSVENQRYEILKYDDLKKLSIDEWVQETASGLKSVKDRKISALLGRMRKENIFLVSELSRLGRNLMEVMSILHDCMERDIKVFSVKEGYELGKNFNSKVLAFAFSLSAEIERNLISQRTKDALSRKKSEGMKLGRPQGSQNKETKLTGKEDDIRKLLDKKVAVSAIARILDVNRLTVRNFIKTRKLGSLNPEN